ncbi:hypothetical protein Tco_1359203, partial [Tanacetum coccineum]
LGCLPRNHSPMISFGLPTCQSKTSPIASLLASRRVRSLVNWRTWSLNLYKYITSLVLCGASLVLGVWDGFAPFERWTILPHECFLKKIPKMARDRELQEALYWMTESEKGVDAEETKETLHPCWAAYHICDKSIIYSHFILCD